MQMELMYMCIVQHNYALHVHLWHLHYVILICCPLMFNKLIQKQYD